VSPMQRSLARFAIARREVEVAPPAGIGLQPSTFADNLLAERVP
jgi:hypothetical protein